MSKVDTKNIVKTSMLLAIAIVIQLLGRSFPQINQFLVGPLINAILILATFICDTKWGVLTGLLTPILAWLVGQLPAPMAPFIPFIIIGNLVYVIAFGVLSKYKYGKYIGILVGSFVKYLFLSFSATKVVYLLDVNIPKKVLEKLAIMMSTPQLVTAIIGGIFALILITLLARRKIIDKY